MSDTFQSKLQRRAALAKVFTPAAPISRREAFSWRYEQISAVIEAVAEPGRHVILYGERGVGKTSLSNILAELYVGDLEHAPKLRPAHHVQRER